MSENKAVTIKSKQIEMILTRARGACIQINLNNTNLLKRNKSAYDR